MVGLPWGQVWGKGVLSNCFTSSLISSGDRICPALTALWQAKERAILSHPLVGVASIESSVYFTASTTSCPLIIAGAARRR